MTVFSIIKLPVLSRSEFMVIRILRLKGRAFSSGELLSSVPDVHSHPVMAFRLLPLSLGHLVRLS